MIYLDNAASTPISNNIMDSVATIVKEYGNPSSIHKKGRAAKNMIEEVRKNILNYIHAEEGTVIFTSGGTESNNLAVLGMAAYMKKNNKKTIITTKIEHPSVLNACKYLENEFGFISFLSISGHKIFAPKGIGALYVKDITILSPVILGGGQENGLRSGTENTLGIACLGMAIKQCEDFALYRMEIVKKLRKIFLDALQSYMKVPYKINYWNGVENIISLTIRKVEGNSLMLMLNNKNVCVSTGSACSFNKLGSSHVLRAIGIEDTDAICTIRISLSSLNTEEEVNTAARIISETAKQLRDLV